MTEEKNKRIIKAPSGMFNELLIRIKLVFRLMGDSRVNVLYKLLPIASLLYLVVPTDLLPFLPFDDALVIWLACYLFIEISPADVVQEHLNELRKVVEIGWDDAPTTPEGNSSANEDVVDAEFKEVND